MTDIRVDVFGGDGQRYDREQLREFGASLGGERSGVVDVVSVEQHLQVASCALQLEAEVARLTELLATANQHVQALIAEVNDKTDALNKIESLCEYGFTPEWTAEMAFWKAQDFVYKAVIKYRKGAKQ